VQDENYIIFWGKVKEKNKKQSSEYRRQNNLRASIKILAL
jgi:hypothetical protein